VIDEPYGTPPPPPPDDPEPPRPHEWTGVAHVIDAHGQDGVVQSCSCGAVRIVPVRWVEWDA
jgi:hypothetical protein